MEWFVQQALSARVRASNLQGTVKNRQVRVWGNWRRSQGARGSCSCTTAGRFPRVSWSTNRGYRKHASTAGPSGRDTGVRPTLAAQQLSSRMGNFLGPTIIKALWSIGQSRYRAPPLCRVVRTNGDAISFLFPMPQAHCAQSNAAEVHSRHDGRSDTRSVCTLPCCLLRTSRGCRATRSAAI
jgi:hypothetical protein